jgi:hypothetical protein
MVIFCISEKAARSARCCGPDGCGTHHVAVGTSQSHYRFCVGAECMAWRWVETHIKKDGKAQLSGDTHGYCGLAGANK